jgi:hypothetical protein
MLHWWWRIKKDASQWRGIKKMNSVLVMEIEGDEQYFVDGNYRFALIENFVSSICKKHGSKLHFWVQICSLHG